jgi:hypothetical protein
MKVTPAFAVPIGYDALDPCDRLNRQLETLFLARESEEYQNPAPSHTPQPEMFESRFNLFTWPEPCIRELRSFVINAVVRAAMAASDITREELARLNLNNHTWFHITRRNGYFVAHNHALASWSAVYCVKNGVEADGSAAGGILRVFDTRAGADAFVDPANQRLQKQYAVGNLDIDLRPGQLVVFPSYLFHEVTPYYGADTRITVATNCWFTA